MTDVWNICRDLIQVIAPLATVAVGYRLTSMILDKPRWKDVRALHLMAWFTIVMIGLITSAGAANYYSRQGDDASPWSMLRLIVVISMLGLSIWWPHPKRYVPIEEAKHVREMGR